MHIAHQCFEDLLNVVTDIKVRMARE